MLSRVVQRKTLLIGLVLVLVAVAMACAPAATPTPTPTRTQAPTATPTPPSQVTATPTPTPTTAAAHVPTGVLVTVGPNTYSMNSNPRFCPACSVADNTGALEDLLAAVRLPDGSIGIEPELATSWQISPDYKYIDFEIRKGVTFHPWRPEWGDPEMTAEDVAWSWNALNPKVTPDSIHDTGGEIATWLDKVTVEGPYKVRFHLARFNASVPLNFLTGYTEGIGIFSKKVFDALGDQGMQEIMVGTGPFIIKKWNKHEGIFSEAVTEHWRQVPYVAEVRQLEVPENATRVAMLQTGEALIGKVNLTDWQGLFDKGFKRAPEGIFSSSTLTFSGNYWETKDLDTGEPVQRERDTSLPWIGNPFELGPEFNPNTPSMQKARKVRLALAMDIDREALNEVIYNSLGEPTPATSLLASDPLYKEKWNIPFDPAKAKQLLTEAGYPNGFQIPRFYVNTQGPGQVEMAEAIAAQWRKDLNIQTTFDRQNYDTFRPSLVERTFKGMFFSGAGSVTQPTSPRTSSASTLTFPGGYSNGMEIPFFGELYLKWADAKTEQEMQQYFEQWMDYNTEWMLFAPLVAVPDYAVYNANQIVEWKMQPENKGLPEGANRFETVRLKSQ